MKKITALIAALGLATFAQPVAAAAPVVRASDPAAMLELLKNAGYVAELTKDEQEDPLIEVELSGWKTFIYFYECSETSHDSCRSVQFSVGFDRKSPWTDEAAIDFSRKYRFASVSLDDEGDPYVTWDVIIGDGIPPSVFLASVLAFTATVEDAADTVFDGDEADKE